MKNGNTENENEILQATKQQIVDIVYEYDMREAYRPRREPGVAVGRGRPSGAISKQFTESELLNEPEMAATAIGKIRGVLMDAGYLDHGA